MRSGYRGQGDPPRANQPVAVVVKLEGGCVKVYDGRRGSYLRTLTAGATAVQVNGDLVTVTMQNGKLNVYDGSKGTYLRSL